MRRYVLHTYNAPDHTWPFLLAALALESLACHRLVYRVLLYCVACGKPYGSSMGIGQMLSTSNTAFHKGIILARQR